MTIVYVSGNLLESPAQALVNTVNCVGVMGKGIALQFKLAYPEMYKSYAAACQEKKVKIGEMWIYAYRDMFEDAGLQRYIINFPTKKHWRDGSKMDWIDDGLVTLREFLVKYKIASVALPPLGCGNGGLQWPLVRRNIELCLKDIDTVVFVYGEAP